MRRYVISLISHNVVEMTHVVGAAKDPLDALGQAFEMYPAWRVVVLVPTPGIELTIDRLSDTLISVEHESLPIFGLVSEVEDA